MKKILAIEDNAVILRILQQRMRDVAFSIAVHPAESVHKAAEEIPDLILLDLMLPERGGIEILHDLKNNPATKNIPVIILSALGSDEDIEKATSEGAQDYIVKGMESMDSVIKKIRTALGEKTTDSQFVTEEISAIPQKTRQKRNQPRTKKKSKTVLFIEDDLFLVRAYQDILEENDLIKVETAKDADAALTRMSSPAPDLVLLDLMLPGKSGFEVLADIRKHPVWKNVPVIILSNLSQPQDVERATKLEITDYIVKANTRIGDVATRIEKFVM